MELSIGNASKQPSVELQDLPLFKMQSPPSKSLEKGHILWFTLILDFHFLTQRWLRRAGTMSFIPEMRWRLCNLLSFTFPQFFKEKEKYLLQRQITSNYLKKFLLELIFADARCAPTHSIFVLVLFSVKLQFCFLQQPELGITLERSTLQGEKHCINSRFLPLTTANCLAGLLIHSRHPQAAEPHYWPWAPASEGSGWSAECSEDSLKLVKQGNSMVWSTANAAC